MRSRFTFSVLAVLTLFLATPLLAQTSAFSYQGQLNDGGTPANGSFQMEFKLFNNATSGSQIGTTISDVPVTVTSGTFRVALDFGTASFTGVKRFLEVAVRRNSGEAYVILSPREEITSAPYAIRSAIAGSATTATVADNAAQLGGLSPARYVQTDVDGNVGIGAAPAAGAKLTVGGSLQITSGAIKFPDSTTQATAGLTAVSTTGPLTGNGTPASPLGIAPVISVRATDHPARQFVQFSGTTNFQTVYTVPAGKAIVIEYVSALATQSSTLPMPIVTVYVRTSNGNTIHPASIPAKSWQDDGLRRWIYSEPVRLYGSATNNISIEISPFPANGCVVRISGYLVDLP